MYIPNNSLSGEINTILKLKEKLKGKRYFEFLPPASIDEINEWEAKNSITIPQGYKDWLMFSNGSIIHGSLAEFYSINKIKIGLAGMPKDSVTIGNVVGDGEKLCFSSENGGFFTFFHGGINEYNSFNDILLSLIDDIDGMN